MNDGYLLDCDGNSTSKLIENLFKYKIRSRIKIEDLSSKFVVGIISFENFENIQKEIDKKELTLEYRESPIFVDPRNSGLGARIISPLEKLYLTIKNLNLKISKVNFTLKKLLI